MVSEEARFPGRDGVLVIDDSDIARAQMVDLLQRAGLKVIGLPRSDGST
jgi:hypothetical protein